MESLNANQKLGYAKRVMAVAGLSFVGIFAAAVLGFTRRDAYRERWLESQTTEYLQTAEARTDADAMVHFTLALRLAQQGKPDDALPAADEAAKSVSAADAPHLARRVFALLAYLDALSGRKIDAEAALSSAKRFGGDDAMIHVSKGLLAAHNGDNASAITEYGNATRLDAKLPEAWSLLASSLIAVAEPQEALVPLRTAAELSPADPQVHADLAEGLGRLALYAEAASECARAANLAPDNPKYAALPAIARASSARTDTDYADAVQLLTTVMQRFPQEDFLHEILAGLHARFGNYTAAREELEPYLAAHASDAGAWLNLSTFCEKLGDRGSAVSAFNRYQRLFDQQIAASLSQPSAGRSPQ